MKAKLHSQNNAAILIPSVGIRSVNYHSSAIGGALFKTLYNGITGWNLQQYYNQKLLKDNSRVADVAMDSFSHARTTVPIGLLKFISKWLSNTLATGKVLQQRRHRIFNRCPRCHSWGEDRAHIVTCWDVRATIIRNKYVDTLRQLLSQLSTHPDIQNFLLNGLMKFFRQPHTTQASSANMTWSQVQLSIGWLNFISGFIAKDMVTMQHEHYKALGL
jgi:hypothetical protein